MSAEALGLDLLSEVREERLDLVRLLWWFMPTSTHNPAIDHADCSYYEPCEPSSHRRSSTSLVISPLTASSQPLIPLYTLGRLIDLTHRLYRSHSLNSSP